MAGLKYSKQREAVLKYLQSTASHPTAENIFLAIREDFPKISLGTVYRNLNLLADNGEILRLRCGSGVEHFDAAVWPHYHCICHCCERVFDLDVDIRSLDEIDCEAGEKFSGRIEGHELYFYGTCSRCLQQKNND